MKRTISALFLTVVLCMAAAFGTSVLVFAAGEAEGTGATSVSFRTDGTETQFVADESSPVGTAGIIKFQDEGEGLSPDKADVLLFNVDAYAVYEFDLDDSVDKAYLTVIGGAFEVAYKAGEDTGYTAFAAQSVAMKYSVRTYELDASNALKADDNTFKIRLTNNESGQICLFKLSVQAADYKVGENISASGNTLDLSSYVVDAGSTGVYFGGAEEKAMFYMKDNGHVTLGFDIDKDVFGKVTLSASFGDASGNAAGTTPKIEYGTDGEVFTEYVAGTEIDVPEGALFVRISHGAGDCMVRDFSLAGTAPAIAAGENGNTAIPADVQEAYFSVGTDAEKSYMFGAGQDFEEAFDATHEGMTVDGHQGGSAITEPNVRKMTAGQYIAYDYDFADTITSGKLVVYAQAGITAKISVDNGASYTTLTASGVPSERGMYMFPLTEDDAFAAEDNSFRLVLQATGETYVFAVSVVSDEAAAAPVSEGVSLRPRSQESMRYLVSTSGLASYYTQGVDEGRGYFFNTTSSNAIFKVPFASGVTATTFYVNQCSNVKIELSDDGETYETVINNLLGGTGDVPYNTFDASKYIGTDGAVWVRITGNENGGGFVFDLGFSGEPANEATGTVDMENFGQYIQSVSNDDNNQGQFLRIAGAPLGADGLIWKLTGDVVFKIDLPDDVIGVEISVQGIAAVTASVYISANGQDWTMMGTADNGAKTFLNYSAVENNASKEIYVRFSSSEYYFDSFSFNTEGIEPQGDASKPYEDGDVDFNYDDPVPGIEEYEPTVLPDPEIPEGVEVSGGGCSGAAIGGGIGAAAAVLVLAVAVIAVFKKRSTRQ